MEPVDIQAIGVELKTLLPKLKDSLAKMDEERKNIGQATSETKKEFKELQDRVDSLDLTVGKFKAGRFLEGQAARKSVADMFLESKGWKDAVEAPGGIDLALRNSQGVVALKVAINEMVCGRKSLITTTAGITQAVTGVTGIQRLPGITGIARQELRIRDLLKVTPMTGGNTYDWVRQTARTNAVSPQVEGSSKAESTYTWDSVSGKVSTIAHWVNITRQALDDVPGLRSEIDGELMYGLELKEEAEILNGDGSGLGPHLNGLTNQATAYDSGTYNVANDTKLDKLRHAKLQARLAGKATFAPDGYVLNPRDMHDIELIKDESGGVANKGLYIVGNPTTGPAVKLVWGLPVVESDSMTVAHFLTGAFSTAAEVIDRMAAMIMISYEHSSNFIQNLATILCEERVGLAVRRPDAFIYGSY